MKSSEGVIANTVIFLLGIWVLGTPWTMSFSEVLSNSPLISWNFAVVGLAITLSAILALVDLKPWEEWTNLTMGLWLLASPWVFGFTDVSYLFWNALFPGVTITIISALALPTAHRAAPPKSFELTLIRNFDI